MADYKPGSLWLGLPGQEVELPARNRTVIPDTEKIEKRVITVDGTICSDLIGDRPVWTIQYKTLTGEEIETILSLYELHEDLNLIIAERDGTVKSYTVTMSTVSRTRFRTSRGWLWKNVSFQLEAVECYL